MSLLMRIFFLAALLVFVVCGVVLVLLWSQDGRRHNEWRSIGVDKVPVGMLGDSDTAAYQDRVSFPVGSMQPGGVFHAITFQWPEVLARLRAQQVDLGPWAVWGVPKWLSMARVRDGLGLAWRGPQRETHQHNLAWASGCNDLNEGAWRQAPRLIDVMNEQPEAWSRGVVVIRIGVNNFGKEADLAALAENPYDPKVLNAMDKCVDAIGQSVRAIHSSHPQVRIVLVGIFNNADWGPYQTKWTSSEAQKNLNQGLDLFDNSLRKMASADKRLAFFDDRAWFSRHWGGRNPETGQPDYMVVRIANGLEVTNTSGDSPNHAVLANLHAGLVWNVLWTQALIDLLKAQFDMELTAITNDEVAAFVSARLREVPDFVGKP
jgi:hypothetical protein